MKISSILIIAGALGGLAYIYSLRERQGSANLELELKKQQEELSALRQQVIEKQKEEESASLAKLSDLKKKHDDAVGKLAGLRRLLQQRQDEAEELQVALQGVPNGLSEKDNINDTNEDIRAESAIIANLKNSLKKWDTAREKAAGEERVILNRDRLTFQQLFADLSAQIKVHQDLAVRYRNDLNSLMPRARDPVVHEQYLLVQAKITDENKTVSELREKLANLKYQWEQERSGSQTSEQRYGSGNRQYSELKRQLAVEEAKLAELTQQKKTQNKAYTDESSQYTKLRSGLKEKQQAILELQQEITATEKLLAQPQP